MMCVGLDSPQELVRYKYLKPVREIGVMFTNFSRDFVGLGASHSMNLIAALTPGDFCFVGSGEGCTADSAFLRRRSHRCRSSFPMGKPWVSPCWMIIML